MLMTVLDVHPHAWWYTREYYQSAQLHQGCMGGIKE